MRIWQSLRSRATFLLNRAGERLWVKPALVCLVSILAAFLAGMADRFEFIEAVPEINANSIETLLRILSSSMLVIAVFAVGSMLSAYHSASSGATPRSFALVVADDVSQNALSTFIGAFIYSIVALVALMNGYYQSNGRFALFLLTIFVFAMVVLSFVRWVDSIARLGRLSTTVDKVESAAEHALRARCNRPRLGAAKISGEPGGREVHASSVGYVQRVDVPALQSFAEEHDVRVRVTALPGALASPRKPVAFVEGLDEDQDLDRIVRAFTVGGDRTFDDDPRFGIVVLAEIASRALSPAVNDPGTAIDIIGTMVRLFTQWAGFVEEAAETEVEFDRVEVPEISIDDLFADAFSSISRDGAGMFEVGVRLQKAFRDLASVGNEAMREAALSYSRTALLHAEKALRLPDELEALKEISVSEATSSEA